ncbi:hypothetical protein, partial [Burkholderia stabilis]
FSSDCRIFTWHRYRCAMLAGMDDKGGDARLAWLSHTPPAGTVTMAQLSPSDCSRAGTSSPHQGRFMLPS